MSKHTSAPWEIVNGYHLVCSKDIRIEIATFAKGDDWEEEQEANKRLIKSAPELLEALRGLHSAMLFGSIEEETKAGVIALKTIAKAEGK